MTLVKTLKKISVFILTFGLLGGALSLSCNREQKDTSGPYFFKGPDLVAQLVSLAKEPQTIISLAPSNTEIVYALGASEKLIAVTNFCDYPPEAQIKDKVGDLMNLNLEKVIKLSPDLVLASTQLLPEKRKILEDAQIAVAVTEGTSLAQTLESILLIGRLTNKQEKAKEIVRRLEQDFAQIKAQTEKLSRPKVYYIVSFGQYGNWTCGKGSFMDELISLAGGENIAHNLNQPWAEFSLEKLVALDPDILLAGKYSGPIENLKNEAGYRELTAVKTGRVYVLDDNLTSRPGPRLADGLALIAKAIHPEVFP